VLDEVTFIAGPPFAVGLAVLVFPHAGVLAAALRLIAGVSALLLQKGTEPPIQMQEQGSRPSVLRLNSVRLMALLMVAMGVIVGTVDIVSGAFAEQITPPGATSVVLSAYALGSCVAGLVFGGLKLNIPLHRLLLLGGLATAATTLPLLLVASVAQLAGAVLLAGLFFAPTMIVAMSLVERVVPEQQLTEGMTWLLAGLNIGVAMGAAASGQMVDQGGASSGFMVALYAAALIVLLALSSH